MFSANDIKQSAAKLDDILNRRAKGNNAAPSTPSTNSTAPTASPAAYQNLNVIRKLNKAKFPVYLTSSKVDNQNYAMKVFSHTGEKPSPYFKNEARFATLKHPNVVNIVHCEKERETLQRGEVKRVSLILMEYAPHGDFFDFLTKHAEKFDDKLVRSFFRQLVDGIEYLHSSGIAHLDLKPENLLVGANLSLKIADFDLSHVKGDAQILSRGTKNYRGPEFFHTDSGSSHNTKIDMPFAADIYSAAIVLFIMKSGGMYPHSENTTFEGVNFVDLMYKNNEEFWKKHSKIQQKDGSFFDQDFKDLFNGMTKFRPEERLTLEKIKQSKWYNGPVYTSFDFERKMKEILKC